MLICFVVSLRAYHCSKMNLKWGFITGITFVHRHRGPQVDIENPSSTRNLMWLCTKQDSNWCSTSSTISTPALSQLLASSDWQADGKAGKISRAMTSIQWLVAATTLLTRNGIGDHSDLFHSSHVIDCPTETYSAKCAS